jgi:hypothetical protein
MIQREGYVTESGNKGKGIIFIGYRRMKTKERKKETRKKENILLKVKKD